MLSRWTYRSVSRCGFSNATPRDTENVKKEICHIFNHNELRITIEANKQTINFLDVTFNLNKNTHQPFTKPYTTLRYVHRGIHAPTTTKDIPAGINKTVIPFIRQSIFRRSRSTKKKALDECGYRYTNTKETKTCNCPKKKTCPLNGNCLQSPQIY